MERIFAQNLLKIQAVKLQPQQPFQWASGILSPIYCDNRIVLSYPNARQLVKEGLTQLAKDKEFDVIAGVATAGIAHGVLLADVLNCPYIYVRSSRKSHGRQNLIEGHLKEGQKVLVIEDLVSTGGSSLQAVEGIRDAGGIVNDTLALFTYGFPEAQEAFSKANCTLNTISNYDILLEEALKMNIINNEDLGILSDWKKDAKNWKPNI